MKQLFFIILLLAPLAVKAEEDRRSVEDTAVSRTQRLTTGEPWVPGPFQPSYESLKAYRCPDWYQDAKFGIWAHWGPQGVAEIGDWYARNMYVEGSGTYKYHLEYYGHPIPANAAGNEDGRKIKELCRGRLVIHGGLDSQGKFHLGEEAVKADVREKIVAFGPGGGYLFGSGHNIQSDFPAQNIAAIFNTHKQVGLY